MGAGNQTVVPFKSSKHSDSLSHLSSTKSETFYQEIIVKKKGDEGTLSVWRQVCAEDQKIQLGGGKW